MLELASRYSTAAIAAIAVLHAAGFWLLAIRARRERKNIAQTLHRFTESLPGRSTLDWTGHLSDQIEAFLADIDEVLSEPPGSPRRNGLRERMQILDERRDYLQSMRFETAWNVARTMIEAYPLAGVLGTICAIGAALAGSQAASVQAIVERFGDAIWSTFAGLVAAIALMLMHSLLEPSFAALADNRAHVRDTVAKAKRELSFSPASPASPKRAPNAAPPPPEGATASAPEGTKR